MLPNHQFLLSILFCMIAIKSMIGMNLSFTSSLTEHSVEFDCIRIPITYCCTTRVRQSCTKQCSTILCDSNFYQAVFTNTNSTVATNSSIKSPLKKSSILININKVSSPTVSPITEEKSVNNSLVHTTVERRTFFRNKLNDGDTTDARIEAQLEQTSRLSQERLNKKINQQNTTTTNHRVSLSTMTKTEDYELVPFVPTSMTSKSTSLLHNISIPLFPNILRWQPSITTASSPLPITFMTGKSSSSEKHWKPFSINVMHHVTATPNWPYTNHLKAQRNVGLERSFSAFLGSYSGTRRSDNSTSAHKVRCGVVPDFLPCVPIAEANSLFAQCCSNKFLPIHCQKLCKYNLTQTEIQATLDMGICGVLHIASIIQCASDGHDNSKCCRYKQLTKKGSEQCEIFCRSGDEIRGLGLQHLVCRKLMKEITSCHLSGLRI